MQEVSDQAIAVLVLGAILISVFIFLVVVGQQSKLEKVSTGKIIAV